MTDLDHMSRALQLAERGRGWVEPNPLVGAVVVRDDAIVGEGWHEKFGQAHAEVNALQQAGERSRGAVLYVTLEPCCHFGKTPPCTEAVIGAGIRRVVFAMLDPFPKVSGQGASRLREAGIDVEVGTGEALARRLNAPYLKRLRTGRAWVHAKWAMTLDGKIATPTGQSKWITGEAARSKVHELRGRMDAIIIGRGTLLADDPLLTARPPGPRTATRIVLTATGEGIPNSCQLLETIQAAPVLVLTTDTSVERFAGWKARGAEIVGLPAIQSTPQTPDAWVGLQSSPSTPGAGVGLQSNPHTPCAVVGTRSVPTTMALDVKSILTELGNRGMTNVLVEGGAGTLGSFLDAGEIDEVHAFISPKLFGGMESLTPVGGVGIAVLTQAPKLSEWTFERVGDDLLIHGLAQADPVT